MQEPRARHSASSTATATQPARWHRSPRPHEASTNVPHIDRKISTRPFSSCRPSWPNVAASAWALQCSTRQVDISRQLAGQQNLLRHIARWRRRFPLAAKATGSNPDGGKGAQGASTGLDLPRAQLERCDARRRRSTFSIVPWWPAPPGREPRQSWPLDSPPSPSPALPPRPPTCRCRRAVLAYLLLTYLLYFRLRILPSFL